MKVKVIIPIYKDGLSDLESRLVRHNISVLATHEISFLLPEGLATVNLEQQIGIQTYDIIRVRRTWLGCERGIAGYNEMMMSYDFYAMFSGYDYILICQPDAYIFRDELLEWCSKGYDYIGAPWYRKAKYNMLPVRIYLKIRQHLHRKHKGFMKQDLHGRVGNGGLSLRKVNSFMAKCQKYSDVIEKMLSKQHYLQNEDVFWALVPVLFKYPSYYEAATFSIDLKPQLCLEMLNGALPFGCHGLTRDEIYEFWKPYLEI